MIIIINNNDNNNNDNNNNDNDNDYDNNNNNNNNNNNDDNNNNNNNNNNNKSGCTCWNTVLSSWGISWKKLQINMSISVSPFRWPIKIRKVSGSHDGVTAPNRPASQ